MVETPNLLPKVRWAGIIIRDPDEVVVEFACQGNALLVGELLRTLPQVFPEGLRTRPSDSRRHRQRGADCQALRFRKDIERCLHNQIVGSLDQGWIWHSVSHLHYPSAQVGGTNPLWIRYFCEIKEMDGAARED